MGRTDRDETEETTIVRLSAPDAIAVRFNGMPPRISGVSEQASTLVADILSPGQIVRRMVVPGRIDMSGLMTGHQLEAVLEKYDDVKEPRILYLTEDVSRATRQTRMVLTLEAGSMGVIFSGTPPVITSVRNTSPFVRILRPGLEIEGMRVGDEYENTEPMTSQHLGAMLSQYVEREDRVLLLRKRRARPSLPAPQAEVAAGNSQDTQTARESLGFTRQVWRQDYESMYTCRAARKSWERARLASHIILVVAMFATVLSIFAVCSGEEMGSASSCYLIFMLPFMVSFSVSVMFVNLSWSKRSIGQYCSKTQAACSLVVLALMTLILVLVDCDSLEEDWCVAVPGLVGAYGAVVLVLINLPSLFTKAMEADQNHDDLTETESIDGSEDGSQQLSFAARHVLESINELDEGEALDSETS